MLKWGLLNWAPSPPDDEGSQPPLGEEILSTIVFVEMPGEKQALITKINEMSLHENNFGGFLQIGLPDMK